MRESEIIRAKFKTKGLLISEYIRSVGSTVTQESWGRVINRDIKVSTELLLRMAGELGCTPEEIKEMMMVRGETVIARLIAPDAISVEDRRFLSKLHDLNGDPKKLKLISDMLDSLRG